MLFFFRLLVFLLLGRFFLLWLWSIEEFVKDRVDLAVENFTSNEWEPNKKEVIFNVDSYL